MNLREYVRDIPDFPEKGIIFRDITPLLKDPEAFKYTIDLLTDKVKDKGYDLVCAPEARGFIFGAPIAYKLGIGFVPIRKPGKLPFDVVSMKYDLEYGKAEIQIHKDAIKKGQKVLLFDDVLATGGTMDATINLIRKSGGIVEDILFLINLTYLPGEKKIKGLGYNVISVLDL
jgi:adenine phosphoribosyltransferase